MFVLVNDQVFSFRNDQVFFSITGTVVSSRNHQGFSFANDQERVKGFFKSEMIHCSSLETIKGFFF